MKLTIGLVLVVWLGASAYAANTIIIPWNPSFQFTTDREYGALSKLTRTDGKDSMGYSLVEKTERSSIVISLGNDSEVRTVESIEALAAGIKVEKRGVKIFEQDCEYLNWRMKDYFYGATHLWLKGKDKKKRLVTVDIVAATKEDLRQVETDLTSLSRFEGIGIK